LISGNAASASANLRALSEHSLENVAAVSLFRGWAELYDKVYATEEEAMKRLKIWMQNHGMFLV
jgi:hypothetical protein